MQWTNEEMKKEGPYKKQTSAERKEALYHDIIDYFSRGKVNIFSLFLCFIFIAHCSYGSVELNSARSCANNTRQLPMIILN